MKTTMHSILIAAVLSAASATAIAATGDVAATPGATSVTEMMQRKHERQLRDQLVTDGRFEQVRQMDEENAIEILEEQDGRYVKANAALARAGNAGGNNQNPLLNECDPDKLRQHSTPR